MTISHSYVPVRKAKNLRAWIFWYASFFCGTAHLVRVFGHSFYINYPNNAV
jgi:hypothetical protein